jgi:hypothetical protein
MAKENAFYFHKQGIYLYACDDYSKIYFRKYSSEDGANENMSEVVSNNSYSTQNSGQKEKTPKKVIKFNGFVRNQGGKFNISDTLSSNTDR